MAVFGFGVLVFGFELFGVFGGLPVSCFDLWNDCWHSCFAARVTVFCAVVWMFVLGFLFEFVWLAIAFVV